MANKILRILALVCFALATISAALPFVSLVPLGLFLWLLSEMV
jgi:hypothetical protein